MGPAVVDLVLGILAVSVPVGGFLYLARDAKADLFPVDMIDELVLGSAEEIGFKGFNFAEGSPFLPDLEKDVLGDLLGGFFRGGGVKDILGKGVDAARIHGRSGLSSALATGTEE